MLDLHEGFEGLGDLCFAHGDVFVDMVADQLKGNRARFYPPAVPSERVGCDGRSRIRLALTDSIITREFSGDTAYTNTLVGPVANFGLNGELSAPAGAKGFKELEEVDRGGTRSAWLCCKNRPESVNCLRWLERGVAA